MVDAELKLKNTKDTIDNMSYEEMTRIWRFGHVVSGYFTGEVGKYFSKVMYAKRDALSVSEAAKVSEKVGWHYN